MRQLFHRWTGFDQVQKLVDSVPNQDGPTFLFRSIELFKVNSVVHCEIKGPVRSTLFVSNHHTGVLDLLAVYPTLKQLAPNLKIVVNQQILKLKPLQPILIGVHPVSSQLRNDQALKEMKMHLAAGGNLLIYPAGKVARKIDGVISDFPWRYGIAELMKANLNAIVPIYVEAQNSSFFYQLRNIFPKLSLLLLLRCLKTNRQQVQAVIGPQLIADHLQTLSREELTLKVREKVYELKKSLQGELNGVN